MPSKSKKNYLATEALYEFINTIEYILDIKYPKSIDHIVKIGIIKLLVFAFCSDRGVLNVKMSFYFIF